MNALGNAIGLVLLFVLAVAASAAFNFFTRPKAKDSEGRPWIEGAPCPYCNSNQVSLVNLGFSWECEGCWKKWPLSAPD